jgi:GWxTD domain-containing protein
MFTLVVAAASHAAVSKTYSDFAKGPAEFLFTKEEKKLWKAIATDEQAKAFIDLFWARRDPTPTTAQNEFKMDFDERVKVADDRFHSTYGPGSSSDRGKVFIAMGSPTKIRRSGSGAPTSTIQTAPSPTATRVPTARTEMLGGNQNYSAKEVWEYERGKTPVNLGQPLVQIGFIDQYATGEWKLERIPQTDLNAVFDSVANGFIAQPDLKSAPVFDEPLAAPAVNAAASFVTSGAVPSTDFKNPSLREAYEQARGAAKPSDTLYVTYGEFVTPKGEHFVPVQLYLPKSAGLVAETPVTFFGVLEKETGDQPAMFEEPATVAATKGGVFYARTLDLLPGRYRGTFGLAKDGKPVGATSIDMVVQGIEAAAPGVSSLILADNIYPLSEAQNPTDPFAFGGLKVVPRSDGVFRKTEDLTYFFEVRNPGLDETSKQPKMSMKMTITGTTTEGKPVRLSGPAAAAPLEELKGVAGHYAVGQALPLGGFKPGVYVLGVTLTDLTSSKSWEMSGTFKVVE